MKFEDLKHLAVTLPEDIMKEKWSGNFDKVRKIIKYQLENEDLSYAMRCRLEYELTELEHFEDRYIWTKEEAMAQMVEVIPDFTEEEFDRLQLEGKIDWIYLNGRVMYINNFRKALLYVYPELWERTEEGDFGSDPEMNEFVENLNHMEETQAHIHIRHELHLKEESAEEGKKLFIHLPVPVERDQIKNLRINNIWPEPARMPQIDEAHPVAFIETIAKEGKVCEVEYEFDNKVVYYDWKKLQGSRIGGCEITGEATKYMEEHLPHIAFTPYLKSLTEEVVGGETDFVLTARKIYDYITTKIKYRFARDYASIDCIPELCASNMKGDCGMQALTFITMCRIAGIPARWQSGLDARPDHVGEHDWAEFYIPSVGWLRSDLSHGGDAYRRGDMKRWDYYFCNVDPFRVPLNNDFQRDFVPPKKFERMDPYDNQTGELEYEDRGLYERDRSRKYFDLGIKLVK